MKYHVEWIENKTGKSGKPYQAMTLKDETGAMFENVTTFDSLSLAGDYEGEIIQNGQYLNFKMKMANPYPKPAGRGIDKAMERKEASITKFADRKEESIALMSSQRDAVLIVTTLYPELASYEEPHKTREIEAKYHQWRKFLLNSNSPLDKAPF